MKDASDSNHVLPHDGFAERALLGAMLIDNKYVNEVFSQINSDDFYRDIHKIIAAAINRLCDNGGRADIVTLAGYLENTRELKLVGGYEYLSSLLDGVPETLSIEDYIAAVKDRSTLRRIITASLGVVKSGSEPRADTQDILTKLQDEIIRIADTEIKQGFHDSAVVVEETLQRIESIQKGGESGGVKTGYLELDNMTGGLQRSDLVVIAARPSMGKTALALNIAVHIALAGKSVGFFSIEMSRHQIMMRLLAIRSEIDMNALATGRRHLNKQEWRNLEMAAGELGKAKIYIDDSATLSIIEMKTRARRLAKEKKLDVIFVDYLQLIKVSGEMLRRSDSRAQEVSIISSSLKAMAKELNIPVVALAQLNRSPEQRGGKKDHGPKYQLSDLKESGAIEQDADVIIFLHREEQNDKETERKGEADIIIAKQRNGPTGKITLAYIDHLTKFANMDFTDRDRDFMD